MREMARKAQDPLGELRALMTDNTIGSNDGHRRGTRALVSALDDEYEVERAVEESVVEDAIVEEAIEDEIIEDAVVEETVESALEDALDDFF